MYKLLLILCALSPLWAEVIDRIAITVDQQVITELQLDEELRVTAFLNNQPIDRSPEARRPAANRLIQQLMVRQEIELRHYPGPRPADIKLYFDQIRKSFSSGTGFNESLKQYALTEEILRRHLAVQLATVQFVDVRFRPDLDISSSDIEGYYRREISKWQTEHPGAQPPTLAQSRESIRNVLASERTSEALSTWLQERRKQMSIAYLDKSLE